MIFDAIMMLVSALAVTRCGDKGWKFAGTMWLVAFGLLGVKLVEDSSGGRVWW